LYEKAQHLFAAQKQPSKVLYAQVSQIPPDESGIIVQCESFTSTENWKFAKREVYALNEVMLVFSAAPGRYRRIGPNVEI
jgi:hypothetical protein